MSTRVPFVHFFDGFRTSHELNTIELLEDDDLRALVSEELVRAHRDRALSPERPFIRGTAQNPDVYFQARETVNPFYARVPDAVQGAMDRLGERTGRRYRLVDYFGDPEAERVLVVMGSGGETVRETVAFLQARGERVGVAQLRLYRPLPARELAAAAQGGPPTSLGGLAELKAAQARLDELMTRVQSRGVELKGWAPLLLDFPAQLDGVVGVRLRDQPADARPAGGRHRPRVVPPH